MKRRIQLKLSLVVSLSFVLVSALTVQSSGAEPAGELVKLFVVGYGATGAGKVRTLSTSWSAILDKYGSPMKSSLEDVPTAILKNRYINSGTIHAYVWAPEVPLDAYHGKKGISQTRLRNLCSGGYPASTVGGFFTRPDTKIKSVKDLKGKVVYADYPPSPWMAEMAEAAFQANGMTKKDCTWLKTTNSSDAFREVTEKRADAIMFVMGTGTQEMAATVGLYVIPLTPAEQAAIQKRLASFQPVVVKKGDEGANADTPLMASEVCLWVGANLNDRTAYHAIKTLFLHLDEFHATFPAAKGFTLQNALNVWLIPYHPGAIAYFKEKGIWNAEAEKKQQALLEVEKTIFK